MNPQDKLAFRMIGFAVLFAVALFAIPPAAYQRYFADLKQRKRHWTVKALLVGVYLLALPYFYDQLVGLDSRALSSLLGLSMGACAYLVLLDVACFIYKNYGPPSQPMRRLHK